MRALAVTAFLSLLPPMALLAQEHAPPPTSLVRDGLVARLEVSPEVAILDWHFAAALPAPLDGLVVEFNDRPLPPPLVAAWPGPELSRTAILAIFDATGGEARSTYQGLDRGRLVVLSRAKRPNQVIVLGSYGSGLQVARQVDGGPFDPVEAAASLEPVEGEPDLFAALNQSIAELATTPTPRRAVFVLTDGHASPALEPDSLIAAARAAGVTVTFIVNPDDRPADLAPLKKIAEASGGNYFEGLTGDTFLADPFRYLESGAFAEIPFDGLRQMPWESRSTLKVSMLYGEERAVLETEVQVPKATMAEVLAFVWATHGPQIAAGFAAGGWILGLLFAVLWRRALRKSKVAAAAEVQHALRPDPSYVSIVPEPELITEPPVGHSESSPVMAPEPVLAPDSTPELPPLEGSELGPILRLLRKDGLSHDDVPLDGTRIEIGSGLACDIILKDSSVPEICAALVVGPEGWVLERCSADVPLLVNGLEVDRALLRPGDRLQFGAIKAKFQEAASSRES